MHLWGSLGVSGRRKPNGRKPNGNERYTKVITIQLSWSLQTLSSHTNINLDSVQAAFAILRLSGVPRPVYATRTVPPAVAAEEFSLFDSLSAWALAVITWKEDPLNSGVQVPSFADFYVNPDVRRLPFSEPQLAQARQPARLGGLGVLSATASSPAAFAAAMASALPRVLARLSPAQEEVLLPRLPTLPLLRHILDSLSHLLTVEMVPPAVLSAAVPATWVRLSAAQPADAAPVDPPDPASSPAGTKEERLAALLYDGEGGRLGGQRVIMTSVHGSSFSTIAPRTQRLPCSNNSEPCGIRPACAARPALAACLF